MKREAGGQQEENSTNEVTLISRRLHWGVFLAPIIITIFLALPLIVELLFLRMFVRLLGLPGLPVFVWLPTIVVILPGLVLFGLVWIAYEDTEYFLTTKRLTFKTGWLLRAKGELPLENVEAVFLVEPLLGRLLGYGTLVVTGIGGTTFPLRYMPEPHRFHHLLQETLEAIRSGRPVKVPSEKIPAAPRRSNPFKQGTILATPAPAPQDPYAERTPFEKAWDELNKPHEEPPNDDSRFKPKP